MSIIKQFNSIDNVQVHYDFITVGTVVDTNDPQQMGRIRVACPAWGDGLPGDLSSEDVDHIPWAMYASPLGGVTSFGTKGPDNGISNVTFGVTAYGFWAIPKIGAQVLVACLDGQPGLRIWLGCLYQQHTPHTMPHGRFSTSSGSDKPDGPLTHDNEYIEPLYTNYTAAFTDLISVEWQTRGADYTVAAVDEAFKDAARVDAPDDKDTKLGDFDYRQGYALSRLEPDREYPNTTKKNYDSQVYSWTTPGFHGLSMDDRVENCRMRFKTSAGHQVILDDTNERIYIMTAQGKNWIQVDQDGSIDIFAETKISIHSKDDINLTADKTLRMFGKEGIHMYSEGEIRAEAKKDIHLKSDANLQIQTAQNVFVLAEGNMNIVGDSVKMTSGGSFDIYSGGGLQASASTSVNLNAGSMILATGSAIHLNGPSAQKANKAEKAKAEPAMWTNRVPDHEPYVRTSTADDFSHTPKYTKDDAAAGKEHSERGKYWRR